MVKGFLFFKHFIFNFRKVLRELEDNKLKSLIPVFVLLYILGVIALFAFVVTPLAPFVYSLF